MKELLSLCPEKLHCPIPLETLLPIKPGMETSENTTSKKLKWIMGDVTKFDFNEELVDVDESNNRLIQFFLVTASFLLIAANILTIQYSFKGLGTTSV